MPRAFHLEAGPDRLATLTFDLPGKKVNVFTRAALEELDEVVSDLALRRDIGCLILVSGKPGTFIAGADVEEIARVSDPVEAEAGSRFGHRLFGAWETLPFPTVAAIQGTCLGGGTELALASTWILLADRPELRIGLPEIKLGIVPGWGGCVRLPRRIGLLDALDIVLGGRAIDAVRAHRLGLGDALLPDAIFLHEVRRFAASVADRPRPRRRRPGGLRAILLEGNRLGRALVFDQARKKALAETRGHYPAPLRALEVIRTGLDRGAAAGLDAEARAIGELATSSQSKNLVHVFRLMEANKRDAAAVEARPVRQVGVLGAGVMGGGIAHLVADRAGLPVRLKDLQGAALATALRHAAGLFGKQLSRRRISAPEMRRRLALLRPTLDFSGFARADLVIEAVVEDLEIKQRLFAEAAAHVPSAAVLATNTSSLSVEAIGALTPGRERVVGLHFFHPVDKMPLVEVVAGSSTSQATVESAVRFAQRLGKTPVVVADGPGFLVNRLLAFYSAEAMWLLDEGHRIEEIDQAMRAWGMPMGPLRLGDEVGLDVSAKVAHTLREAFPDRLFFPAWLDRLPAAGRLGAKSGRGFYRYEGQREAVPDPAVYDLLGLAPRRDHADRAALAERMVLPMVNEAARCLNERLVTSAGDLDLAMILGTGFPPFRGGLCRWADSCGPGGVVERLQALAGAHGPRFEPSAALLETAARGGFFAPSTGAP